MKKQMFTLAILAIAFISMSLLNTSCAQQSSPTESNNNNTSLKNNSTEQVQNQQANAPNLNTRNIDPNNLISSESGKNTDDKVVAAARNTNPNASNIQVAILLDTSNSMDGLIDQAKSQLWKMVNELALARDEDGEIPNMEIALYSYGNDNFAKGDGYIKQIAPLTTDLDLISEKLFDLTTRGGDEYCGHVIQTATQQLKWSDSMDDLKIIFIAGNEPFTQGGVDYTKSCKAAITDGIIINTIYCGNEAEGINTKWKDGADLADGKYLNIDQNQTVVHIDAPQDTRINQLNEELNKTYIGYGSKGKAKKERQKRQDSNAASYGAANTTQRAISKASKSYKNADWDLVDAVEESEVSVEEMEEEALPDEMKSMDKAERKAYVDEMSKKRKAIQDEISTLNKDRRKHIDAERKKQATDNTLDGAIIKTIRKQATGKKFDFDSE